MHIFGGTAMTGFICALYSVARSLLAVGLLLPLGYASFYTLPVRSVITTLYHKPPQCIAHAATRAANLEATLVS